MWNKVTREHFSSQLGWHGDLYWPEELEEQRGLCWAVKAKCKVCNYVSKKYKLYDEVQSQSKRGRKFADPNIAVAAALTQTSSGPSSLRKVILATNTLAPLTNTLQKCTEHIAPGIAELTKCDIQEKRQIIKDVIKLRSGESCAIPVEGDACYNNPLYSGVGRTPFQPATQATYTVVENVTPDKFIVAASLKNKLCVKGSRNKLECPNHTGCTANLPIDHTIGNEQQMALECMQDMLADNIQVSHVTTDPDSSAYRAATILHNEGRYNEKPISLTDTRHLAANQRKDIKNVKFSAKFFPGRLKSDREYAKSIFSIDLSKRCELEFIRSFNEHGGDMHKVKRDMTYTKFAIGSY